MALVPATLQSGILEHLQEPKETTEDAADGWSDAIGDYVQKITPSSAGIDAGKEAFRSALLANPSPTGLTTALTDFAASVASGMVPPGIPPAAPLDFSSFLSNPDRTYEEAASELTTLIDLWWRTGLTAPPGSIPWS